MPSPSASSFTFPSTTEPVFSASTSEPVIESPNYTQPPPTNFQSRNSNNITHHSPQTIMPNFLLKRREEYDRKRTGRDPKGNIMILPPVSIEEQIAVQRETKARTILLQSLPEDHMADFHHLDDARDIWLDVKARFGGNDESKNIRKSMLKQDFSEFRVSESEGLHKGYDSDPQQQITYEDFHQIGKLDLEELDIKWQMAMLSVRINRFEKKARRKMKFNNKDAARVESVLLMYMGMMLAEVDVADNNATGDVADDVSNAAAEFALMGISSQVQTCPFGCEHLYAELKKEFDNVEAQYKECYIQVQAYKSTLQTLEQQKGWYQSNQLALEERIRILTANLENTTNMLKYTEKLNEQAKLEKLNDKVQLEETKARFDKWKDSSKNLDKLIHSSMSSRSKFGLGFGETFGSDEVFDPSGPSIFDTTPEDVAEKPLYDRFVKAVRMHAVPPLITGTFIPPSNNPDLDDTQFTYGSKSNNYFDTNSVSNDFVSCDNSDKSSDSETTDFASCVSSVKSSSYKTNEPIASAPSSVAFQSMSQTADQQPSSTNDNSNCDFYEKQLELHYKPMWNNVANIPSFVPKAASVPAGSRNRPTYVPAGLAIITTCIWMREDGELLLSPQQVILGEFEGQICNGDPRAMENPHKNRDLGIVDSGCSRSMTGNKEKLDDFVKIMGGTVTFGELQNFNLFSVSQICDTKNKVLFTDKECLVLSKEFQLPENSQVVLRVPRRNNLYCFNLSDIKPERDVTCLLAKASLVESTKWHRRMAHVNFKNMNKLAKHGLVNGLPSKLFTNEYNCVACNKGKQHKASYKAITAVSTISAPLQLLHMDLFGPTSIRSIDHKYYSLVVTDDFSRFTWVFFLGTKDETYGILKDFITFIENQLTKKVKAIRCDNRTEFKISKLIELCGSKGIRRDYSNARTPQQNGVAERKNRTLIEAARTMLADSKLPTMFWTEAVSTACYVLNRVLVTKPHNKTPYELVSGKVPNISHLKPFGCLVTILNTSDHLGKFEGKADEGFIVGYAAHSKAYRVYNLSSKKIEETLNLRYLEDKPNVQGLGHEWYFDLDYLTDSLGYTRFKTNQPAGPSSSNGPSVMERNADYAEELAKLQRQEYEAKDAAARYGYLFSQATAEILCQAEAEIRNQGVSAVRDPAGIDSAVRDPAGIDSAVRDPAGIDSAVRDTAAINSAGDESAGSPSAGSDPAGGNPADSSQPAGSFEPADESNPAVSSSVSADFIPVYADESTLPPGQSLGSSANTTRFPLPSDVCMDQLSSGIFTSSSYDDDFRATLTNLAPAVEVNPVPTKRVNTIHPQSQILGDLASPVMTRSRAQKSKFGESAFIGYIQNQQRTNHTDQLHCLFGCFLSQLEPTSIAK
ncbi:putative ribonuclease H-like domain-containing protein, partial [Tanacetum coccineum]